ncbi:glycosyltransferase [Rhodoblastus acidophilus]|uniref:Glycosyltransferase n=1 Tax=Rhodoblastus acidophilus TaxID=1074 RepID=A0A6N8DTN3_RHOAC|nr:glycosyltransferase family A protein [Rhodoblastus acidophilus]MCW2275237.1 GT2 family glycosyltransferase [Rhodoblastus acidophilus]MTV32204.1 glycosyltransferase [Rhodoblastus acidophilus]
MAAGFFNDQDWANEANCPADSFPAPRRWDIVLTCGEPFAPGDQGLAGETLRLLGALAAEAPDRAILLICAEPLDPALELFHVPSKHEKALDSCFDAFSLREPASTSLENALRPALAGASVLVAPPRQNAFGRYVHFLEAPALRFAFAAAELLLELQRRGHEFALACCADRGAEGFFIEKMRRHGQLRLDGLAVRLHGPTALAFEDRAAPLHDMSTEARNLLVEEIACLRRADILVHRDDATWARVQKLCRRFGFDAQARARRETAPLWSALRPPPPRLPAEPENLPVGFVIPHFNNAAFIEGCLASVRACAEPGDEILVVDDASRPQEKQALRDLVARLNAQGAPEIVLHELPHNGGPAAARNAGVEKLGRAELVQFIDADDALHPEGFRATRRALLLNPDLAMVYGMQRNFGADRFYWVTMDPNPLTIFDENFCHSAPLVRRAVFAALGGQATALRRHYEDWEFNVRLHLSGFAGEMVVAQTQQYRMGHASRTFEKAEKTNQSREALMAHVARARLSGHPHRDRLAATLAVYAAKLEHAGLLCPAAGQSRSQSVQQRTVEIVNLIDLEEQLKTQPLPVWRKKLARLALSVARRLGRARRK